MIALLTMEDYKEGYLIVWANYVSPCNSIDRFHSHATKNKSRTIRCIKLRNWDVIEDKEIRHFVQVLSLCVSPNFR